MSNPIDALNDSYKEAQTLIMMIEHCGTAEPIDGTFFETFNGSIVHVYDQLKRPSGSSMTLAVWASAHGFTSNPQHMTATILRGGHGVNDLHGEHVGHHYDVDADGMIKAEQNAFLQYPRILGLCLKRAICDVDFILKDLSNAPEA